MLEPKLLVVTRPVPSPLHTYRQDLSKLNLQMLTYAEERLRVLNGSKLSVNGLCSIEGVDRLITTEINLSSPPPIRLADLEGLPSNNTMGPFNTRGLRVVREFQYVRKRAPG